MQKKEPTITLSKSKTKSLQGIWNYCGSRMFFISAVVTFLFACSSGQNPSQIEAPESPAQPKQEFVSRDIPKKEFPEDSVQFLLGRFYPEKDSAFCQIESKYASRTGMQLNCEAYQAFKKMHEAAKKGGVELKIISATRNFYDQKRIWEAKWNGQRLVGGRDLSQIQDKKERAITILKYSSMPGTSRHHWGTDIDLNSLNNSYFESDAGLKVYQWLKKNAVQFGFCQPYSEKGKGRPNGYEEEKWHWSYLPVARQLLDKYQQHVSHDKLTGFDGAEVAKNIDVIKNYIAGINSECL